MLISPSNGDMPSGGPTGSPIGYFIEYAQLSELFYLYRRRNTTHPVY